MKKIVINNCYGGFSLSRKAIEYIVSKGGGSLEKYEPKKYYGGRKGWEDDFKADLERSDDWGIIVIDGFIWSSRDIERNDSLLIEAVEKLKDKANGMCAKLKVVEIPDGVDWEIDEYDGLENVEEKHRSWG